MSTKKTPDAASSQFSASADAYMERLEQGQQRFAATLDTVRTRSARVADKVVESMLASQRDALALGKTLAAEPTAYGKNMEVFVQSLSSAQERALELAKTLYREQSDVAGEYRASAEKFFAAGKSLGQPFEKLTEMWTPAAK